MNEDRTEDPYREMREAIKAAASQPGVSGVLLLTREGLLVAREGLAAEEATAMGNLSSSLLSLGQRMASAVGTPGGHWLSVETAQYRVVLAAVSSELFLMGLLPREAPPSTAVKRVLDTVRTLARLSENLGVTPDRLAEKIGKEAPSASHDEDAPTTVLVVDDEQDIQESVAGLLVDGISDIRVLTAGSGAEGLRILEKEHVDLIVTDHRMPGMSGLEFLGHARKRWPQIPRIMLTAYPDVKLAVSAINDERISYFLTKPFDPDDLVEEVRGCLREKEILDVRGLLRKRPSLRLWDDDEPGVAQ